MATDAVEQVEDKLFSVWQKRQLQALLLGIIVELGLYLVLVAMNGFSYTHYLIGQYKIPVAFFAGMLLAIAPLYRKTDDKLLKIIKQFSWTGLVLVSISIPPWFYYLFNPPTTGWDNIVYELSNIFFFVAIVKGVLVGLATNRRAKKETL